MNDTTINSIVKKSYTRVRLLNYWAWYIWKYAPTLRKLKQKLFTKTEDYNDINVVLDELKQYIDEDTMAINFIKQILDSGKSLNVGIRKLKEKLYDEAVIKEIKETFSDNLPNEIQLKKRIENYISKGKGLSYIQMKLWSGKSEKEQIKTLFNEIIVEPGKSEEDIIFQIVEKLRKNGKDDQKIIRKLIADGFQYWKVRKIISGYIPIE